MLTTLPAEVLPRHRQWLAAWKDAAAPATKRPAVQEAPAPAAAQNDAEWWDINSIPLDALCTAGATTAMAEAILRARAERPFDSGACAPFPAMQPIARTRTRGLIRSSAIVAQAASSKFGRVLRLREGTAGAVPDACRRVVSLGPAKVEAGGSSDPSAPSRM